MKLSVEDRPYKLGETIDLAVALSPRRDLEVRQARLELVCDERWMEITTVMVQLRPSGVRGVPSPSAADATVPKQVHQEHKEATFTVPPRSSKTGSSSLVQRPDMALH